MKLTLDIVKTRIGTAEEEVDKLEVRDVTGAVVYYAVDREGYGPAFGAEYGILLALQKAGAIRLAITPAALAMFD